MDTATHPDNQGRGIFRRLTPTSLDVLREAGMSHVFNTPNEQSRPGYLKMGWEQVGKLPVGVRFRSPLEARVHLGDWRIDYNCKRPHTAHGDLTPTEFATTWTTHQPKAA